MIGAAIQSDPTEWAEPWIANQATDRPLVSRSSVVGTIGATFWERLVIVCQKLVRLRQGSLAVTRYAVHRILLARRRDQGCLIDGVTLLPDITCAFLLGDQWTQQSVRQSVQLSPSNLSRGVLVVPASSACSPTSNTPPTPCKEITVTAPELHW